MPSEKAISEARAVLGDCKTYAYPIRFLAEAYDQRDALQAKLDAQAKAFSDVAREVASWHEGPTGHALTVCAKLAPFILPEPQPDVLAEVIEEVCGTGLMFTAETLRAHLAQRGWGITQLGDKGEG